MAKVVYEVIENSELYPTLYSTYESARDAVTTKYAAVLRAEWEDAEEMNDPDYKMASIIVDENERGKQTYLYINKGIHVFIRRRNVQKYI